MGDDVMIGRILRQWWPAAVALGFWSLSMPAWAQDITQFSPTIFEGTEFAKTSGKIVLKTGGIAASKLVGSDITTVGTVGTGTWQGTVVAGQYGGTGVANTGKTITLGGNLVTSGAFATTLTATATTSITLPTTGTLATLAGTETLTNKTITAPVFSGTATGTYTLGGTPTLSGGTLSGTTTLPGSGQINSSGDLGLGKTPAARLDLHQTADTISGGIRIENSGVTSSTRIWVDAGGLARISAGGTEASFIALNGGGTGRVGIGTVLPQSLLQIGTTAGTARIYNIFTDASNGEWAYLGDWGKTANVATYGTDKNGTGSTRNVQIMIGGTSKLNYGVTTAGVWTSPDPVRLSTGYTVAGLPASAGAGARAYVTDQLTACVGAGAAITGGGAVVCPVFYNGTAWVGD